jgi:hypothetical protein
MNMNSIVKTILVCGLLLPLGLKAQLIDEAVIKVGKDHKNGFIATSKYGKAQMKDMLAKKMDETGLRKAGRKSKFITYKGATWPVTGANMVDIYYKVSGKKHKSKVYFVVSKGYNNYITAATDAAAAGKISEYLGQLDNAIALNEQIQQKQEEIQAMNIALDKEKANIKKTENDRDKKKQEVQKLQKTEAY